MNLYLITRTDTGDGSFCYDTYDAAVVAARSEDEARRTHPAGKNPAHYLGETWVAPAHVLVKLIGRAVVGTDAGVIVASFNAG